MDAKLKEDWVKALRSGGYRQGIGKLRSGDEFCCLGVLCQIAGVEISPDGMGAGLSGYKPLAKLIGKEDLSPLFLRNDGHGKFAKHSFPEMADYIEANL